MANREHVAELNKGVDSWNRWRTAQADDFVPDLHGANFNGADLRHANLREAVLSKADLSGADFRSADLINGDLSAAVLSMSNLSTAKLNAAKLNGAELTGVNLTSTDLRFADLTGANLINAKVDGANFQSAFFRQTIIGDTDLRGALGLESCNHIGPSTLGIDTLFKSGGAIPEVFLSGCGVPERLINYARSLMGQAIEFYSCFISHSSKDQVFAERLNADLRAKDLRCWFAPEDLKIGDRFQELIEESIRIQDKLMIVLSEASVKSPWVEREVLAAREREDREKRTVLFPIRIDDAVMNTPQPWAADIRRARHIGDFSKWQNHDCYKKAFDRLLRDLKSTERLEGGGRQTSPLAEASKIDPIAEYRRSQVQASLNQMASHQVDFIRWLLDRGEIEETVATDISGLHPHSVREGIDLGQKTGLVSVRTGSSLLAPGGARFCSINPNLVEALIRIFSHQAKPPSS